MSFQDAPLDPSYKMNKDGQRAISPEGIEFKVGDKVTSIQNEKETGTISGFKQEQGRIKALVNKGMFVTSYDIAGLKKDESTNPWDKFKGRMIPEAIKKYIDKHKDDKEKMGKLKDMVKKIKEAGEKTAIVTTTSGKKTAVDYKTDDELRSIGDNADVRSLETGVGRKVK